MSIYKKILESTNCESNAELFEKIVGHIIANSLHACWFIFASNVIFHTNFTYGLKEIFSFYLVVNIIERITTKKK